MQPSEHISAAYQFLDASNDYAVAVASLIKSEMLWCAAAHCVKAVANQYGLANASHADLFRAAQQLARRLPDPSLRSGFSVASDLHKNMYEGQMSAAQLVIAAAVVRRFVIRMDAILAAHPQLPP